MPCKFPETIIRRRNKKKRMIIRGTYNGSLLTFVVLPIDIQTLEHMIMEMQECLIRMLAYL